MRCSRVFTTALQRGTGRDGATTRQVLVIKWDQGSTSSGRVNGSELYDLFGLCRHLFVKLLFSVDRGMDE